MQSLLLHRSSNQNGAAKAAQEITRDRRPATPTTQHNALGTGRLCHGQKAKPNVLIGLTFSAGRRQRQREDPVGEFRRPVTEQPQQTQGYRK